MFPRTELIFRSDKIKANCRRDNSQTLKWQNSWQYKGSVKGDELRTGMYKRQAEMVKTDRQTDF